MSIKDIITVIVSILSLLVALFSLISSRKSSSSASRSLVITRNQAKFSQVQAFTSPVPATLKLTSIVYENASSTEVGERANKELSRIEPIRSYCSLFVPIQIESFP